MKKLRIHQLLAIWFSFQQWQKHPSWQVKCNEGFVVAFKAYAWQVDEDGNNVHVLWKARFGADDICKRYKMTTIRPQVIILHQEPLPAQRYGCPAFIEVSAGEPTIPNEVDVMATDHEENNQVIATAEQEHQGNNEEGIDKNCKEVPPAPPAEVWWHQMSRSFHINNIIGNYSLCPIKKTPPRTLLWTYSGILPKRHDILVQRNETYSLMYNIKSGQNSLNARV